MNPLAFHKSGQESGVPWVLGHSLGSDHRVWDEVAEELGQVGPVLRWDLPGHGESELPDPPASMGAVASWVLSRLDQLGVEQFYLGGISLGGMVSLAVAQRAPARVLGLAVLDAGPALPPAEMWTARAEQVRGEGMSPLVGGTMERWFQPSFRTGPGRSRYLRTEETFRRCDPLGYAYCCEVIADTDLRGGLETLTMPTLVVTGAEDPGMTPAQAKTLAGQIPGAGGQERIVEDSRHMTCVEHPEEIAELLLELASPK